VPHLQAPVTDHTSLLSLGHWSVVCYSSLTRPKPDRH